MKCLLVSDAPGHILERIARSFAQYGVGADHVLACSQVVSPYLIRRRGERIGMLHWIDPLAFGAYANAARAPQVVMVHHLTEPEIPSMIRNLRHADFLTTSSKRWQRRLTELTSLPVELISYTIDTEVFRPMQGDIALARREFGIADGHFVIGYSGKAAADAFGRKGVDILRSVLKAASERWRDLTVLLIGSGWEHLDSTASAWGIQVLRYQPQQTEDTAAIYPLMDVLLSTSREEGGPCTILEAMGCEVPVVTTDVGHVPEVIVDGENGFIAPWPDPVPAFLYALGHLRQNAALRSGIVACGRKTMVQQRDVRTVIPRVPFDRLYTEASQRYSRRPRSQIFTRSLALSRVGLRYIARQAINRVAGSSDAAAGT